MVVLFSSSVVSTFNNFSLFASGVEPVLVEDESALRIAVDAADGSAIIALTSDIILTDSALGIPYGKDITLVSDKPEGFWKLIGVADQNTIDVKGKLTIDGIIVTHRKGFGCGVCVNGGGTFFMYSGEISDNKGVKGDSCGVYNMGTFVMSGGTISNNTADVDGGGVYSRDGMFSMSGGTISNNSAVEGGGVCLVNSNLRVFTYGEIMLLFESE